MGLFDSAKKLQKKVRTATRDATKGTPFEKVTKKITGIDVAKNPIKGVIEAHVDAGKFFFSKEAIQGGMKLFTGGRSALEEEARKTPIGGAAFDAANGDTSGLEYALKKEGLEQLGEATGTDPALLGALADNGASLRVDAMVQLGGNRAGTKPPIVIRGTGALAPDYSQKGGGGGIGAPGIKTPKRGIIDEILSVFGLA